MRFSVIIPLYNKAPYVSKAIDSVLSQTFGDYELVVMDDGSSDDSFDAASKAIGGHHNCHIHRQQNAGVSTARNNAVALSNGEYLCFLDADDWWSPAFLEEMDKLIDEYPEAGIYGTNYTIVNEAKHKTRIASVAVEPRFEKGYINYCRVYAASMYMPLWTGAVCIPRKVFVEMNGFNPLLRLGEDFDLWIRIALEYKVAFLNEPLSYYNQDSAAQWRAVSHLQEPRYHVLWNLGYLEEKEKTDPDYKRLVDNLRTMGLLSYYLSREYRKDAKKELDKVDWAKQSPKIRNQYNMPIFALQCQKALQRIGSVIKQWLFKYI